MIGTHYDLGEKTTGRRGKCRFIYLSRRCLTVANFLLSRAEHHPKKFFLENFASKQKLRLD